MVPEGADRDLSMSTYDRGVIPDFLICLNIEFIGTIFIHVTFILM